MTRTGSVRAPNACRLTDCPNGMGYVPVTVRPLKAQGFTVTNLNLGIPTTVIGRDFADPRRAVRTDSSSATSSRTRCRSCRRTRRSSRSSPASTRSTSITGGARRRRRRERSERVHRRAGAGVRRPTTRRCWPASRASRRPPRIVVAQRAERGRPAVPRRRVAGAASGGAARRRSA